MLWKRIVEFGFYLLYNQLAWSYDAVSWGVSRGEWRKWQLTSLEFVKGPAVLEIAHGPGHMLVEMHRRGWQVVALDLSSSMGRLAQARLKRQGIKDGVSLIQSRIPMLPLQSAQFDTVLSQFPTDFIFKGDTLKALHRLLKPAGRLVILPEGHLTGSGWVTNVIDWLFYITGQTLAKRSDKSSDELDDELEGLEGLFWENVCDQLSTAGFDAEIKTIERERSCATVIVAYKKGEMFV